MKKSKPATVVAVLIVGFSLGLAQPTSAQLVPWSGSPFGTPWPNEAATVGMRGLSPNTLDRLHAPILRSDLKLLGAQSCAAASCHGGPQPGVAQPWVSRGGESTLWFENDPHARSWATLSSHESVAMMRRLKIMHGNQIVDREGFDNCLACHNTTKRFHEPRTTVERKEGVGCSGCHGPEEQWSSTHYRYGFDPLGSTEIGFIANRDLLTRARTCAACHVGDRDRDMNHDIIAAGHPALRYEFATYHAWQPKHWRDTEASDRTFYEPQLWLAGQIAAADASLSLLQSRAAQTNAVGEWPELAAFDCSSCHHSLGLKNARRTPGRGSDQAVAPFSTWNTAGLLWVIRYRTEQGVATKEDERLAFALDEVRLAMESGPIPNRTRTAAAVSEARLAIAAWVDGAAGQSERAIFRSDRLGHVAASAAGKTRSFDSWESAVQLYLATVAARESWPGGPSGSLNDTAEALRRGLAYPQRTSSPEFALRQRTGAAATRDEVRRMTLELAGALGPIVIDQEPLPAATEPSAEQLQREIDDLLKQLTERGEQHPELKPPAGPRQPPQPGPPQPGTPRAEPPADPRPVPPAQPNATQTLDELRKKLEALQGDSSDQ